MHATAIGLSLGSLVVVMGSLIAYLRTIPRNKVPLSVTGFAIRLIVGLGLAVAAVGWNIWDTGTLRVAVILPAAFATMFSAFFLYVLSQRKTPVGELKVQVGDELLAFAAVTSAGSPFSSSELAQKRTLLKFFRGGW